MTVETDYEAAATLHDYLLFHYGSPDQLCDFPFKPPGIENFLQRVVDQLVLPIEGLSARPKRALDLGCAVGRAAFELSRRVDQVIAIDRSERLIAAAKELQKTGEIAVSRRIEGEIVDQQLVRLDAGYRATVIEFQEGDALALPAALGSFDIVLMANLVDRVTDPAQLLRKVTMSVRPEGQLIVTSPYTWLPQFTPRTLWLAGSSTSAEGRTSFDAMKEILSSEFSLEDRRDLPFLIREHRRKYQWSVADGMRWRRR